MSEQAKKIVEDIKVAMKAHDEVKTSILRMAHAALKNKQIELMRELNDEEAEKVLRSLIKQYKDSIVDFEKGGRQDLVEKISKEIAILETYVPAAVSEEDVRTVVGAVVKELDASGLQYFGKVMGAVMKKLGSSADGTVVSRMVKELLG